MRGCFDGKGLRLTRDIQRRSSLEFSLRNGLYSQLFSSQCKICSSILIPRLFWKLDGAWERGYLSILIPRLSWKLDGAWERGYLSILIPRLSWKLDGAWERGYLTSMTMNVTQ